jgi:ABC-type sugar transport system permease subunit
MRIRGEMPSARARFLLALPLVLVLAPFLVWPVLSGLIASFTSFSPFQAHPHFIGLDNFRYLILDGYFRAAFRTVAIFTCMTVCAELTLGFGIALLLKEPFPGRGMLRVLLLLPWLIGPIPNGVMWHFLLASDSGIAGWLMGLFGLPAPPSPLGVRGHALPIVMLIEIWQKTPLVTFLLCPGVFSLPQTFSDQAVIEGASPLYRVRHVVLPWIRPLLLAVTLILTGQALGAFDSMLMLTGGGPGSETLTPALYSYRMAFQSNNWPVGAASAWTITAVFIPACVGYLMLVRRKEDQ